MLLFNGVTHGVHYLVAAFLVGDIGQDYPVEIDKRHNIPEALGIRHSVECSSSPVTLSVL